MTSGISGGVFGNAIKQPLKFKAAYTKIGEAPTPAELKAIAKQDRVPVGAIWTSSSPSQYGTQHYLFTGQHSTEAQHHADMGTLDTFCKSVKNLQLVPNVANTKPLDAITEGGSSDEEKK